jgi:hypothetical protein
MNMAGFGLFESKSAVQKQGEQQSVSQEHSQEIKGRTHVK